MFIADLHIHSKYARATSKDCVPEMLDLWARRKGLDLIGTGDFTHPAWRAELKEKLVPAEEGLYRLRDDLRVEGDTAPAERAPRFLVTGEISSIYKKNDRVRKIHNLILLPGLAEAEALSHRLEAMGFNLHSDGRPILGLDSRDLLEITLEVCPSAVFIPAHIWTPHFSLFGAYSGFDTIEECFGDLTGHIHALETGLSSDPPMNWRISALDGYTLVSNSDAHSPANLAREANLFDTELSYPHIARALQEAGSGEFAGTLEFFPEEGKYHYDGHRNCGVCLKPSDTEAASGICPVCGKKITVGVLHRVESLADRPEGFVPPSARHFESLVPLREVIAASTGFSAASKKVGERYEGLLRALGSEFRILRETEAGELEKAAGPLVAEGIRRLRAGKVEVLPGYDGAYGKVKILDEQEIGTLSGQLYFFGAEKRPAKAAERAAEKAGGREKGGAPGSGQERAKPEKPPRQKAATQKPDASAEALRELNREQQEAAGADARAVAVIAGPGTGKTKTLVSRIVRLVRQAGVPPAQITAVTFTNRAAEEMRVRLAAYLGDKRAVNALQIGTFHAICLRILSENGESPTVIDEQDALSILAEIAGKLPGKVSARDALRKISLLKSGVAPDSDPLPAGLYDRYCRQLTAYGVMDYDDILLNTLALFERGGLGSREEEVRNSFTHLLVDEFQDVNPVQYRLIRAWSKTGGGIFVIGDPDQAIYGFRGSDSRCFARFFEDFPEAKRVRLVQNYRSTPEILGCAAAVLPEKAPAEALQPRRSGGAKVRLVEAEGDLSEGIFIAKEINRMVGGMDMLETEARHGEVQARSFADIAVLYRTNRQAALLESCLEKEGIPYTVAGRDDLLAAPAVRRAAAFFRFLLDPADLFSLRLCLREWKVCPEEALPQVLKSYAARRESAGGDEAAGSLLKPALGTPQPSGGGQDFAGLLRKYGALVRSEKPQRLVEEWISDNGLRDEKSMEQFSGMAVLYDTMPAFLQNLLLGRESDIVRCGGKTYSPDAVSLMTLHAAKGLEFPVVFVSGVEEGCIPLRNRGGRFDDAEERRLLYVGMTRAKDELLLLAASGRSPYLANLPAAFLAEGAAFERKREPRFEQISLF